MSVNVLKDTLIFQGGNRKILRWCSPGLSMACDENT